MHNTPQTPSTLIKALSEHGLKPNKKLSQNFLVDKNILKNIIAVTHLKNGDCVLEIGPGCGALTKDLLDNGARVLAIEKDKGLYSFLKKSLPHPNLTLLHHDFLSMDLPSYVKTATSLKIVANIPYNITSCILDKLTSIYEKLDTITIMVQKEMAERITAKPGPQNNAFAIFAQSLFTIKILFPVPKNCYYPKPQVTSCVIQLTPYQKPVIPEKNFQVFVKGLFQKKRKMLRNSFSLKCLESCHIPETYRPENLSLQQALSLFALQKDLRQR